MAESIRIGELAKRANVTPRTIRYYETLHLIPPGEREGTGQHYYPADLVLRLKKIDQLKRLGLTLEEVGSVIDLYFSDPSGKKAKRSVLEILKKHLAHTEAQLHELGQFRTELRHHIARFEEWLAKAAH